MVLTLKGIQGRPLTATIQKLMTCFRRLRRFPAWKANVKGGAYVIEVTRNRELSTWHAHLHILYDGLYYPQHQLLGQWFEVTEDSKNVWVAPAHGQHANRLSNYCGKPADLEGWPTPDIVEYALATQGLRMVQTFGKMHAVPLCDADELPKHEGTRYTITLRDLRRLTAAHNPIARVVLGYLCDRYVALRGLAHGLLDLPPPDTPTLPRDQEEAWDALISNASRYLVRFCEEVKPTPHELLQTSGTGTQSRSKKKSEPMLPIGMERRD